MLNELSFDLHTLRSGYLAGKFTPAEVIAEARRRAGGGNPVWISMTDNAPAAAFDPAKPLSGIPFAVKDNIDVAGMETTAGCPAYAYRPEKTATAVQRLLDAGAVLIGKTNLDQFATGLVGVRSPYGACGSVFDETYVSGGSSSGSAVAVGKGMVTFSLGTDTAGSGRVPAAFNNLVGLKATKGLIPASGVVPACRTLDCVTVFALTCGDAEAVLQVAGGFDETDSYSRPARVAAQPWTVGQFRFGVPQKALLQFFGDVEAEALYWRSVAKLEALGGTKVEIDFQGFRDSADLLYAGPWVSERLAAISSFVAANAAAMHPVVRTIIQGASRYSAQDGFEAEYKLAALRRRTAAEWAKMDVLLLPTTGTIYKIAAVEADPVQLNTNLGYYTNFVNLLDLSAVALPAGFRGNGLPFGVTLMAPAFCEKGLLQMADRLHRAQGKHLGGTMALLSDTPALEAGAVPPGCVAVAVVGAHLSGMPLNWQLTERGAKLLRTTRTAAHYKFYALPGTTPPKPGLVRTANAAGSGIEVEVWAIPVEAYGSFVALVPAPLSIGSLTLADGSAVQGFLCEPYAVDGATEITHLGGWRHYMATLAKPSR
jgi:allophanate hydrolase